MSKYEQLLKNKNLKVTPQRLNILNEIDRVGHATIEEIYGNIRQTYPSISLATIYKNVFTLCSTKILQEVKIQANKPRYEILGENHPHMVCIKCGRLQDLHCSPQSLIHIQNLPEDFKLSNVSIIFYGECQHCGSN